MQEDKRATILIVDDTQFSIRMLSSILESDYNIITTNNGHDALGLAEEQMPDLILLDIVMPQLNGIEVCKILKQNPTTKGIPIIFITSLSEKTDEAEGFAAGAVDYITKPISMPIVQARIKNQIELKKYRDLLEDMSMTDMRTGIANCRYFETVYEREFRDAARYKTSIAVISIKIDLFRRFNEYYGYFRGDECLNMVAQALKNSLFRPADLLARYRGSEFICMLPNTSLQGALTVAETLQKVVNELNIPFESSELSEHVTIRIGLASVIPASQSDNPKELIDTAFAKLDLAKQNGRNRIEA